jgi:hypothetical protein
MIDIEGFLIEIDQIPWFANVGKPSELDGQALRITSWEAYPGPETPGCDLSAQAYGKRREWLDAAGDPSQIEAAYQRIRDRVFMQAIPRVPWKDEEDVWYAPNAAVVSAGWNAALVGVSRSLGIDLDERGFGGEWTLASEWGWLRAGHWPCMYFWQWGYTELSKAILSGEAGQLIVY